MRELKDCFDSVFLKSISGFLSIHNFGVDTKLFDLCSVKERAFLNFMKNLVVRFRFMDENGERLEYFKDYKQYEFTDYDSFFTVKGSGVNDQTGPQGVPNSIKNHDKDSPISNESQTSQTPTGKVEAGSLGESQVPADYYFGFNLQNLENSPGYVVSVPYIHQYWKMMTYTVLELLASVGRNLSEKFRIAEFFSEQGNTHLVETLRLILHNQKPNNLFSDLISIRFQESIPLLFNKYDQIFYMTEYTALWTDARMNNSLYTHKAISNLKENKELRNFLNQLLFPMLTQLVKRGCSKQDAADVERNVDLWRRPFFFRNPPMTKFHFEQEWIEQKNNVFNVSQIMMKEGDCSPLLVELHLLYNVSKLLSVYVVYLVPSSTHLAREVCLRILDLMDAFKDQTHSDHFEIKQILANGGPHQEQSLSALCQGLQSYLACFGNREAETFERVCKVFDELIVLTQSQGTC